MAFIVVADTDLSRQLEVVVDGVAGLDDGVAPGEARHEDHAQAVQVTIAGTAPLVKNLRCYNIGKITYLTTLIFSLYPYS